jgi:hypothetical protein
MASTLDLYIDTSSGQLVDGGSVVGGSLPTLTRNDSYTLRLRLLEKNPNGTFDDINFSNASLKAGIGTIEEPPSAGAFKLAINGVTSSAIPYNATAVCVYNAVSNNVSTVALYGSESFGSYLLTASQPNTAMSFSTDAFTLFPASSALVGTRRNPSASVEAQQTIKLVRNPIIYADTFISSPTSGEISLAEIQAGSSTKNETYEMTVGPRVRGGSFALVFGPNTTTAIPLFSSAVSVQTAISQGITTVTSNCSVQENGKQGYIITFTGRLGLTNVSTVLTLDSSGVQFIPFQQTTLTINTAEVEDAFSDSSEDIITPTLEIELTQNGTPKTIYQGGITIRKDLITAGSTVPGDQASYYTKAEADAIFLTGATGGINIDGRALLDSTSVTALNYQNRTLNDYLGSNAVSWVDGVQLLSNKLGFYNNTATAQPASTNVISALVNLGLVANTVTLGNVVSQSSVNVDAISQDLYSGGQVSIDWGNRSLRNSSGTTVAFWNSTALSIGQSSSQINLVFTDSASFNSISFGTGSGSKIGTATAQKIGFWNATPVTQPNQANVVSALRGCGFIASGPSVSTFGVLPLSPRTLTTTASLAFGTVAQNSSNAITVALTGAATNDIVLLGLPSAISAGLSFYGTVESAGVVEVDAVNATNSSIDQSTQTFRITVIGY